MRRPAWGATIAAVGAAVLSFAGCVPYDAPTPIFEIKNLTGEQLILTPLDHTPVTVRATPGAITGIPVNQDVCDSFGWVATSESGTIVAQIPGGCRGYLWTIRGINDSTYEKVA